jgi:hypothetical protein
VWLCVCVAVCPVRTDTANTSHSGWLGRWLPCVADLSVGLCSQAYVIYRQHDRIVSQRLCDFLRGFSLCAQLQADGHATPCSLRTTLLAHDCRAVAARADAPGAAEALAARYGVDLRGLCD